MTQSTTINEAASADVNSLLYRPEFVEGDEAANAASLTEYGALVSRRIEEMQRDRESWRDELRELYAADVEQDDHARELKRRVLISEAENLANPTYHRWLNSRTRHGVGDEKIDDWFHVEAIQLATPYMAVVPCPRSLSSTGLQLVEEQVRELFQMPAADDAKAGETCEAREYFTIEWWPILQHSMNSKSQQHQQQQQQEEGEVAGAGAGGGERRRRASDKAIRWRSPPELCAAIQTDAALRASLVESPCLLLADHKAEERLAAPTSTPVLAIVVRGTLIAVEPYYGDGEEVLFPSALVAPGAANGSSLTSATSPVLVELREWLEGVALEGLPERSFMAVVMVQCGATQRTAGSSSPSPLVRFSLLNMASVDAVDCRYFTWNDLVGLIVSAQGAREQLSAMEAINALMEDNKKAQQGGGGAAAGEGGEEANNVATTTTTEMQRERDELLAPAGPAAGQPAANSNNNSANSAAQTAAEREYAERIRAEQQRLTAAAAQRVDVVFRGPWRRLEETGDAATAGGGAAASNNINNGSNDPPATTVVQQTQQQQHQQATSSSFLSDYGYYIAAGAACVAGVAAGVAIGVRMATSSNASQNRQ